MWTIVLSAASPPLRAVRSQALLSRNPARFSQSRSARLLARDLPSPRIIAGDIRMKHLLRTFVHDVSGATAIEYALLCAMLALAIITGLSGIGLKLSGYFAEVSSAFK